MSATYNKQHNFVYSTYTDIGVCTYIRIQIIQEHKFVAEWMRVFNEVNDEFRTQIKLHSDKWFKANYEPCCLLITYVKI